MNPLEKIRKKIDRIDQDILKGLVRRALCAREIGKLKNRSGSEIYSVAREREIIDRLLAQKIGPMEPEDVETIFQEIFNVSRNLQRRLKVAFFGPEATFTHQVAIKHFGQGAQMLPQRTIGDVFDEVEKGRADYGVVPIENSTEGVVNHTLDMFMESGLVICAEREESISQYLLSSSGQLSKIKKVYSHPQALAQCRRWLESRLPKAERVESPSTADAASQASLDAGVAAIASSLAAKLYHLKVAAANIQDFQENSTRFLVIGKHYAGPSGKDKTSIFVSVKDRVGALNDLLLVFKKYNLNLTKIESRPTKKKAWEYVFFMDFIGHSTEPAVQRALAELKKSCLYIKILGSYPRSE